MIPFSLKQIAARLSYERTARLHVYIDTLQRHTRIPRESERKQIEELTHRFHRLHLRIFMFKSVRMFFYLLLYISLVSAILSDLPYTQYVERVGYAIAELIGTTLSFLMIALLTRLIDLNIGSSQTLGSHIVAIYAKHQPSDADQLFDDLKKLL